MSKDDTNPRIRRHNANGSELDPVQTPEKPKKPGLFSRIGAFFSKLTTVDLEKSAEKDVQRLGALGDKMEAAGRREANLRDIGTDTAK